MHLMHLAIGVVAALGLGPATAAGGDGGLVRTTWPSPDDPGMPFYARVELFPPFIFNDGEWAAIIFYRQPECVPAEFNLITVFDVPAAFACPHTVHGESLWRGAYLNGSPMVVTMSGDGAVPIWFVPWASVEEQATPDGVLTVGGLEQIEGRLVGHAHRYTETLQPHPDPAFGGGGHPNPKMIVDADGQLEDGRRFHLHITWEDDEVKAIRIDL